MRLQTKTKTQELPPTTKLLQQHTVKLCSNYNSVAVTAKTVWYKRFSVITNVLLVCSNYNSVVITEKTVWGKRFFVIPKVFFGCCNQTVFWLSQTFYQHGFHITRLLQTFFNSPKRNGMYGVTQFRFSQLHSLNELRLSEISFRRNEFLLCVQLSFPF